MSHSVCEEVDKNTTVSMTSPSTSANTTTNNNNNNNSNNAQQLDSLSIFCREVRNLLRSKPNCLIPFSKFVPAYHNHYGRQCCVYQFGYTKLIELLESIPHVVQIISDASGNRYITLTHREQIKRFASDLIKVVKSQPGKRLRLSQFARAYEQVLGRQFCIEDYGTNDINVLLVEIWEGTINIIPINKDLADVSEPLFVAGKQSTSTIGSSSCNDNNNYYRNKRNESPPTSQSAPNQNYPKNPILDQLVAATPLINKPYITSNYPDVWFEIPKRERSEKEIKRTKYFVWDVIELLSKMGPDYSVPFSKFIPSYHYYFNRQCKVSIFGFSKLIDLFESISPDVVEIVDQGAGEEKLIRLAPKYRPSRASGHGPNGSRRGYAASTGTFRGGFNRHSSNNSSRQQVNNSLSSPPSRYQRNSYDGNGIGNSNNNSSARPRARYNPAGGSGGGSSRASSRVIDNFDEDFDDVEDEDDDDANEDVDCGVEDDERDTCVDDEEFADDLLIMAPMKSAQASSSSSQSCTSSPASTRSLSSSSQADPIDKGPTEAELLELEDELQKYEELKAIQSKRSTRMAALLDIFKRQAC